MGDEGGAANYVTLVSDGEQPRLQLGTPLGWVDVVPGDWVAKLVAGFAPMPAHLFDQLYVENGEIDDPLAFRVAALPPEEPQDEPSAEMPAPGVETPTPDPVDDPPAPAPKRKAAAPVEPDPAP